MSVSIGDVIEQDGKQVKVIDVQTSVGEYGETLTFMTTEPV